MLVIILSERSTDFNPWTCLKALFFIVCKLAKVTCNSSKSTPNSKKSSGEIVGCDNRDNDSDRRLLNLKKYIRECKQKWNEMFQC